jgi:5-methyltetrahydrofolate--homocysteine methyltransferase
MDRDYLLTRIKDAVFQGEEDQAREKAMEALANGIEPLDIIQTAIVPGIEKAGEYWKEGRYFIPDIVLSAEAFKSAMGVVEGKLETGKSQKRGRIVIGVVEGDMHDLGKNIVTAMLQAGQFEVIDLGVNITANEFLEAIKNYRPHILGLGAYMSTTMLYMREVIEALVHNGFRDHLKVMIGGVPITQHYADEIGADAYGRDALDALEKAQQFIPFA